jgi:hypothetical protein
VIVRSDLSRAAELIHHICCVAGSASLIEDARNEGRPPLQLAITHRNTPALFNWLVKILSYQGISDRAAARYLQQHGSITWRDVTQALSKSPACPKLQSYWHFHRCGYSKAKRSCNCPNLFESCPLPKHDLRSGRLNQMAYSLFLFLRDVAGNDLVAWVDHRLASSTVRQNTPTAALIAPLRHVYGVADKVLGMALATLLLAAGPERNTWIAAGARLIAIDSLVHKFLHRTGLLKRFHMEHRYGPACYGTEGCTGLVLKLSARINAREFNRDYPGYFPRFVQHAIWRYCAQDGHDICNSLRISDRKSCGNIYCRVFRRCDRQRIGTD